MSTRERPPPAAAQFPSVAGVVAELRRLGSKTVREGLARYAIPSDAAFGIPVGTLRQLGKRLGRSQELALQLWETGFYEARLLAIFVAEPGQVTPALMERWCRDFDSWALCDTACFHLFDRTAHVFAKIRVWARRKPELEKRAAFALLASAALHDKRGPDQPYLDCLPLIEAAATDGRNFVKKAVSWALKGVGGRGPQTHAAALELARQLSQSADTSARWVGKDALKDLQKPATLRRVARRRSADPPPAEKRPTKKRPAKKRATTGATARRRRPASARA